MKRSFPMLKSPTPSTAIWTEYVPHGKPIRARVNNRSIYTNPIMNQLGLGDCAGVSSTQARMAAHTLAGLPYEVLSALAEYYEARVIMGTIDQDSGQTTDAMVQAYEQFGAMPDQDDPYANYQQTWKNAPPNDWDATLKLTPSQVLHTTTLQGYKELVDAGYPVLIAFAVFDEMEGGVVADTGWLSMPANPLKELGGHMTNGIGYDDDLAVALPMNEWGPQWGLKIPGLEGCFCMPYEYFDKYVFDVIAFAPDNNVPEKQTPTPAPLPKPPRDTFTVELGFDKPTVSPGTTVNLTANVLKNNQPWSTPNCTLQIARGNNMVIEQTVPVVNGIANLSQVLIQPGTYTGAVMVYDEYHDLLSQTATVTVTAPAPAPVTPPGPTDVTGTQWQAVAEWAVNNHVMFDYGDGTFKPDQPISRGQMAASLMNLYNLLKH